MQRTVKHLVGLSIHEILKEFFMELKETFIARKEKVAIFEDIEDVPLNKEQLYEVKIFN